MNVRELIEILEDISPDAIVILQKDSEGNGFSPCVGAEQAWYEADSTWSGQVIDADYLAIEEDAEVDEIQDRLHATPICVVLWPVN
jgi:hypothetical protein